MRDQRFSISYSDKEVARVERNMMLHGLKFSDYVRRCLLDSAVFVARLTQDREPRTHRRTVVLTQEEMARFREDAEIASLSRARYIRARTLRGFPHRSPGKVLQRLVGEIEAERKKMGLTERGLLKLMRRVKIINGEYQGWDGRKLVVIKPWRYADGGADKKESGVSPADVLPEVDEDSQPQGSRRQGGEGEGGSGRVSLPSTRPQVAQNGRAQSTERGMEGVPPPSARPQSAKDRQGQSAERGIEGVCPADEGERESGSVSPSSTLPQTAGSRRVQPAEGGMEGVTRAGAKVQADEARQRVGSRREGGGGEGGSGRVLSPSTLPQTAGSRRVQPAERGMEGVTRAGAKVQADEARQRVGSRGEGGEGEGGSGRVSLPSTRPQVARDGRPQVAERGMKGVPSPSARLRIAQGSQAQNGQAQSAKRGMEGVPPPSALPQTAGSRRGQSAGGGSSGVCPADVLPQVKEGGRQGKEGERESGGVSRAGAKARSGRMQGKEGERESGRAFSSSVRSQVAQDGQARAAEGGVKKGNGKARVRDDGARGRVGGASVDDARAVAIAKKRQLSMEKEWMACRSVEVDEDDIEIEGSEGVYTGRGEVISERERRRRLEERGLEGEELFEDGGDDFVVLDE
jgi:hypothetical protein